MKKLSFIIMVVLFAALFVPGTGSAAADLYTGDTSIYGGSPVYLQPNVLIILDSSGSMDSDPYIAAGSYISTATYTETNNCNNDGGNRNNDKCITDAVYQNDAYYAPLDDITTDCQSKDPHAILIAKGTVDARLERSGTGAGSCNLNRNSKTYQTGHYINWLNSPSPTTKSKLEIAKTVVKDIVTSTDGVRFGLMRFHNTTTAYNTGDAQGSEFMNSAITGTTGKYVTTIKTMDDIFSGTTTNRQALVQVVDTFTGNGYTPLGESFVEALRYFKGQAPDFGATVGKIASSGTYSSPIQYSCQKNYIIFVTDGASTADNSDKLEFINTYFGRYDGGGCNTTLYPTCANDKAHSLAGAAKYLYDVDMFSDKPEIQNVVSYAIGFGFDPSEADDREAKDLLSQATDSRHGNGKYFDASSEAELTKALKGVLTEINAVDTSYVAPVVPVSPENRTYSGSKVYMGFFKPLTPEPWKGNVKKFALHPTTNAVLDANGLAATDSDGKFKPTVVSYWSTTTDGAYADKGGVGDLLQKRDLSTRNIYTLLGATPDTDLTAAANAFTTSIITAASLSVGSDAEKDDLVNFYRGYDTYLDNPNHAKTDNRDWIMGDILHSKPLIVHYTRNIPVDGELECTWNKSIIYVGANDGMLHAFRDCDGQEEWAFIPPDLLPNLQLLSAAQRASHPYFVDASPSVYVYDANTNSVIESGDKVVLMFGERRGGGYYYALDVTTPTSPRYMWRIGSAAASITSPADAVFPNLAETWSEPKIVKMVISGTEKIVAVVGAGYDNVDEDSRYGNTQTFLGTGAVDLTDRGITGTSAGTSAPSSTKGRGIYLAEIAYLTSGVPTFYASPNYTWIPTGANFSVPSEVHTVDTNGDGFIDRLYVGDTGGNLYRVNETSTLWTINTIFSSNSGTGNGHKIFYKPDVGIAVDGNDKVYFGTGDREHPLNKAVVDRMYGFWDKAGTVAKHESDMQDVTTNVLQLGATTASEITTLLSDISTGYGWFIKLDQRGGEKVLAPSRLLNGVAYYTTYAPDQGGVVTDPCVAGNVGSGHLYAVDYGTGEAVLNFDASNDPQYTTLHAQNIRATPSENIVLQRSDRELGLPSGIPSGLVIIVSASGEASGLISAGDSLIKLPLKSPSVVFPLYWRIL